MKQTQTTFDKAPDIVTPIIQVPWLNTPPNDYELLFNKPTSAVQYFATDIQCTSWATADWTYREISVGSDWDTWVTYTQTILVGLGSTTAVVTKQVDMIYYVWNIFKLPPWRVIEITARVPTATWVLRVDYAWSMRYMLWSSSDMTTTNNHIILLNTNTTTTDITMKFATSVADRPTVGYLIRIY